MKKTDGFTLVEMLVSVAVLALLIVMVSSMVNSTGRVINQNRTQMDADNAGRQILDRISSDLSLMAKRKDLNYIFSKQTGNDAMFFFGEAPAANSGTANCSTSALIGYRVTGASPYFPGTPVLERLGKKLLWDGPASTGSAGGMVFLAYSGGTVVPQSTIGGNWASLIGAPPSYSGTDASASHVISSQVFRMETCFFLKSGTYSLSGTSFITGSTGYSSTPTGAPTTLAPPIITASSYSGAAPDGNVYGFPPDLVGVVVTIAVLDDTSRKMITGSQIAAIANSLPDSVDGQLPGQAWQTKLEDRTFASSIGVPPSVISQIRIYQRMVYFNLN